MSVRAYKRRQSGRKVRRLKTALEGAPAMLFGERAAAFDADYDAHLAELYARARAADPQADAEITEAAENDPDGSLWRERWRARKEAEGESTVERPWNPFGEETA